MGMSISVSEGTILVGAFQQDYNELGEVYVEDAGGAYFFKDLDDDACPTVFSSQTPSICDGETFTVGISTYGVSGTYVDVLSSESGCDSIVTTYLNVITDEPYSFLIEICAGESYAVGGSVYTESGTYTDILTAGAGCDSIVITELVVFPTVADNAIMDDGEGNIVALSAEALTFQWLFCDPYEVIDGATEATYTPLIGASYAVIADNEAGCPDTSACLIFGDDGDAVIMPGTGVGPTQTACEGRLLDSGGSVGTYSTDEDAQITIAPTDATSIDINFVDFDVEGMFECGYDWMKVYDGPDLASRL